MRDTVNLQMLRKSRNTKHNTIYGKAHRIINENYSTPYLKEVEVMSLAEGFPTLAVHVVMGGDIAIRSIKDNWMIRDEGRFYTLYHKGVLTDKGRYKDSYHVQDVFKDLNYIFASIVSHDDFKMGVKKRSAHGIKELICS